MFSCRRISHYFCIHCICSCHISVLLLQALVQGALAGLALCLLLFEPGLELLELLLLPVGDGSCPAELPPLVARARLLAVDPLAVRPAFMARDGGVVAEAVLPEVVVVVLEMRALVDPGLLLLFRLLFHVRLSFPEKARLAILSPQAGTFYSPMSDRSVIESQPRTGFPR